MVGGDDAIQVPVKEGVRKMTFKARITLPDKEYSGVMVIKATEEGYRMAFFNEMGMSYLEGSVKTDSYPMKITWQTVNPLISSKRLLRDLETALNLLLVRQESLVGEADVTTSDWRIRVVVAYPDGGGNPGASGGGAEISDTDPSKRAGIKECREALFEYQARGLDYPSRVIIEFGRGRLRLELERIGNGTPSGS